MITEATVNSSKQALKIADLLTLERIQVKSEATSKKRVLELISQLISQALPEMNYKILFEHFVLREKLGSTAIGHGIAIPHIRLDNLEHPIAALVTLDQPIDFNGSTKTSVDIIVALVVPADAPQQVHLNLLQAIASRLHGDTIQQALRQSHSSETAYQLMAGTH